MSADWKTIREVYERALDLEPGERHAFVAAACADDPLVRREVEAMLAALEPTDNLALPTVPGATEILPRASAEEPRPNAARLRPGLIVDGKYRIDGVLGAGGMGAVYRATHLQLERAVALKGIRAELLESLTAAERFRREAVAVARLRHPHIVTVYDYGVTPEAGAFLVMELLEGHSLREELIGGARLDVAAALAIVAQVCAAVGAAHRAGVIHRDVKPENIFLERRDGAVTVKVVDFGLAKLETALQSTDSVLTHEGAVLGTPVYMAPEQCRGDEADARSDVYAIGCVLYEMLTGRPPFTGRNAWALVYKHVNEAPPPPGELAPWLAPEVQEALTRALAKDPANRHQTAEAFAEALGVSVISGSTPVTTAALTGAATAAAPAVTAPGAKRPPDNLPHAVTHFVGRERQIDEVLEWLERARLVTLAGPGGIGKTRLALEAAARVVDQYEDGVWLVELASLADPAFVAHAVVSALGVREHGGRSDLETLEAWLRDKRVLLVLDNCEHLVSACAELAARLLGAAAGLRVLATSRESLAVAGEAVWQVPALAVPAPGAGGGLACEAVRLFADRAALARPGFLVTPSLAPVVAELCRRLEGIPLAIELAAARVRALTVEQILARLDDRFRLLAGGSRSLPTRQQALQTTLDWSYELLTDEERALFRGLGVFAGGWTLEAAEAVGAGGSRSPDAPDALDLLTRLVDKSLVTVHERRGTVRYGMLEMIRAYAADLLSRSEEADDVRRRHAEFFCEQAEATRDTAWARQSPESLERMEEEHDNVRTAFAWLLGNDPDEALRLAAALNPFREMRGHLAESRRCLEAALARSRAAPADLRVTALLSVANVAMIQADLAAARECFERGLAVAREADIPRRVVGAIFGLGALANLEGDREAARARLEECLEIGRREGYADIVCVSLNSLGEVARLEGDWAAARDLYQQAIAVGRAEGNDSFRMLVLCNMGAAAWGGGDVDLAHACYEEAIAMAQALGSKEFVSLSLDGLAAVAARRGAWERAARLAGAAEALLESIGASLAPVDRAFRECYLASVRERLGDAAVEAALAEGRAMEPERAVQDSLSV